MAFCNARRKVLMSAPPGWLEAALISNFSRQVEIFHGLVKNHLHQGVVLLPGQVLPHVVHGGAHFGGGVPRWAVGGRLVYPGQTNGNTSVCRTGHPPPGGNCSGTAVRGPAARGAPGRFRCDTSALMCSNASLRQVATRPLLKSSGLPRSK